MGKSLGLDTARSLAWQQHFPTGMWIMALYWRCRFCRVDEVAALFGVKQQHFPDTSTRTGFTLFIYCILRAVKFPLFSFPAVLPLQINFINNSFYCCYKITFHIWVPFKRANFNIDLITSGRLSKHTELPYSILLGTLPLFVPPKADEPKTEPAKPWSITVASYKVHVLHISTPKMYSRMLMTQSFQVPQVSSYQPWTELTTCWLLFFMIYTSLFTLTFPRIKINVLFCSEWQCYSSAN